MSMLDSQIKEPREKADELRDMGMTDTPDLLREAADTIESLRDRLQESYGQVPEQGEREDEGERESCGEVCGNDRFELIAKAKQKLLDATNIEMRPDEMAVLDNILFRCWQMGWLDQLHEDNSCAECAEGMGRYADSLCDPLKQRIAELEGQRDALLRCLENDYGIRASWDGLRRVWLTESVTVELDYIEDKSRWFELFGKPERAAQTLSKTFIACECEDTHCDVCPLFNPITDGCNYTRDYDVLLEWLKGEDEVIDEPDTIRNELMDADLLMGDAE